MENKVKEKIKGENKSNDHKDGHERVNSQATFPYQTQNQMIHTRMLIQKTLNICLIFSKVGRGTSRDLTQPTLKGTQLKFISASCPILFRLSTA